MDQVSSSSSEAADSDPYRYKMDYRCLGTCVIINNKNFHKKIRKYFHSAVHMYWFPADFFYFISHFTNDTYSEVMWEECRWNRVLQNGWDIWSRFFFHRRHFYLSQHKSTDVNSKMAKFYVVTSLQGCCIVCAGLLITGLLAQLNRT